MTPDYARNMRLIGYSDQGGRCDGVQIMVQDGYAYIGHQFSNGFSVVDVRDPRDPKTVNYVKSPPGTWSIHLQAHEDLLLVINCMNLYGDPKLTNEAVYYSGSMAEKTRNARGYSAGIRVYDISDRPNPREALCRSTASECTASGMPAAAGPMRRPCSTASSMPS